MRNERDLMKLLKEYSKKYGLKEVVNNYGEHRQTQENSIIFPNGWVASIVENHGVDVWQPDGKHTKEFKSNKKYSVAMCDYNGFFDWEILNRYGATEGCIYCDTELEIIIACEVIRNLVRKYIVVCYSVHEKEIASHDSFDNEDDAYAFLEKDAQNTYEEEMNNASEEDKDTIDFTMSDDGTAYLSSCDGEYEWTWEVIETV